MMSGMRSASGGSPHALRPWPMARPLMVLTLIHVDWATYPDVETVMGEDQRCAVQKAPSVARAMAVPLVLPAVRLAAVSLGQLVELVQQLAKRVPTDDMLP